jgi:hypothetical protein
LNPSDLTARTALKLSQTEEFELLVRRITRRSHPNNRPARNANETLSSSAKFLVIDNSSAFSPSPLLCGFLGSGAVTAETVQLATLLPLLTLAALHVVKAENRPDSAYREPLFPVSVQDETHDFSGVHCLAPCIVRLQGQRISPKPVPGIFES